MLDPLKTLLNFQSQSLALSLRGESWNTELRKGTQRLRSLVQLFAFGGMRKEKKRERKKWHGKTVWAECKTSY